MLGPISKTLDFIEKIKNTENSEINVKTVLGIPVDPYFNKKNYDEEKIVDLVVEKKLGTLIFPDSVPESILPSTNNRVISPGRRSLIIITGKEIDL